MTQTNNNEFIRTTMYLPRSLHEQAKIMAILTRSNLSMFMRSALIDKIKQVKDKHDSYKT